MSIQKNPMAHHLPEGTMLNGKYHIEHSIGEGGFGITYKGFDTLLNMPIAVKEYFPNGFAVRFSKSSLDVTLTDENSPEYFTKWKEKFLNEARTLASLNDIRSIVNVRDYFEENGTAYIVMEYLSGKTLKEIVESEGRIEPIKMTGMLLPLLKSLQRVHEQGMIHRDISPDNIMLMPDGMLKLFDFGAARDFSAQGQHSLSVMLKPGYAPQEQYRSKGKQGPWTDIYAICATFYYCITGIVPDDCMQRVFEDELKSPSALGIAIPSNVEDAIMKGLNIKEEERFQNVEELIDALARKTDTNVLRISNSSFRKPVSSESANRTSLMPNGEAPAGNRTSLMPNGEAPADNRTSLMPNGEAPAESTVPPAPVEVTPAANDKPAEKIVRTDVMPTRNTPVQASQEKQIDVPAPKKKKLSVAAKIGIAAAAVAAVIGAVVIINVSGRIASIADKVGTDSIVLKDKVISVEGIEKLIGKETSYLTFENCQLEDGVLRTIGKTEMPELFSISFTDCTGDCDYSVIDFSKYENIRYLLFVNSGASSNVLAGSGPLEEIEEIRVTDPQVDMSFLKKIRKAGIITINSDSFEMAGDEFFGMDIRCLELSGYSETPELSTETMENILKLDSNYFYGLKLKQVQLSDEAQATLKEALPNWSRLQWLDLSNSGITSLDIASGCEGLRTLIADGNTINDLDPLKKLIRLEDISLCGTGLTDISGLSNCTALQTVLLRDNNITDASVLDKSANSLQYVDISGNPNLCGNIGMPENWTELRKLNISDTGEYGKTLKLYGRELRSLIAANCSIGLIEFAASPKELNFADVSGNKLSGDKVFEELSNADTLIACDNLFSDLSEVYLKSDVISDLYLNGNKITALPGLSNATVKGLISLDYDQFTTDELVNRLKTSALFGKYYINDTSLDKVIEYEEALGKTNIVFDKEREEANRKIASLIADAENIEQYNIHDGFIITYY